MSANSDREEAIISANLKAQLNWMMSKDTHSVLLQLQSILTKIARRYPLGKFTPGRADAKPEKFTFISEFDQLKCTVTITGDNITCAEMTFKVSNHSVCRTSIKQPWKIQQIQDSTNFLQQAIWHVENVEDDYLFKSPAEAINLIQSVMDSLLRAQFTLMLPRKKPMEEVINSQNMKELSPNLPDDLAISFYIESPRLIFVLYHLKNDDGAMSVDLCETECFVPWIGDVMPMLARSLKICQLFMSKMKHHM